MFGVHLTLCLVALSLSGIEPKTQDFECSLHNPCKYGQGDCDTKKEGLDCEGSLVCGHNNCDGEFGKQPQGDKYKDDCCSTNKDWCNSFDRIPSSRQECCSEDHKCQLGHGDCEIDADCQFGLVCGTNNCKSEFGHNARETDDCCTTKCSKENRCHLGDGDCEMDKDCQLGLMCGTNNCKSEFGHNDAKHTDDCCTSKLSRCVANPWWRCCSYNNPCDEHGGDCEYDDHCKDGLVCGSNNCHKFHLGAHPKMDCCEKRTYG